MRFFNGNKKIVQSCTIFLGIIFLGIFCAACVSLPASHQATVAQANIPRGSAIAIKDISMNYKFGDETQKQNIENLLSMGLSTNGLKVVSENAQYALNLKLHATNYLQDLNSYSSVLCEMSIVKISDGTLVTETVITEDVTASVQSYTYMRDLLERVVTASLTAQVHKSL